MSWVRMDDTLDDHPKVAGCSDAAFRVWIRCIFYASRLRTDGVVPRAIFSRLGATKKVRDELLGAGLLDEHEDGVSVHDYLDFQESRKQIEARQAATRERVTKHRVTRAVTPLQPPLLTPTVTEHTVPNSTEQNLREDLPTCKGGSKDLTGQSDPPRPEDTPAHVRKLERSFWPTVHLWEGPTDAHRTFARQNGLDVELEAKQYRANRRKCDFRCADFNADFEEWLAKSLKFARRTPAASSSDSEHTRELNDADKAAIAKARRAARRAMEGA